MKICKMYQKSVAIEANRANAAATCWSVSVVMKNIRGVVEDVAAYERCHPPREPDTELQPKDNSAHNEADREKRQDTQAGAQEGKVLLGNKDDSLRPANVQRVVIPAAGITPGEENRLAAQPANRNAPKTMRKPQPGARAYSATLS